MDQANFSQQKTANPSSEMGPEAVQAIEAAFDDTLKQLQQTLAAQKQLCAFVSPAACRAALVDSTRGCLLDTAPPRGRC